MTDHFWLGMSIAFLSGIFNGSFALPMKYSRSWRWENTWLMFSVGALLFFPWLLALVFTPNLAAVYRTTSRHALFYPLLFGLLWGFAQTTFGLGISAVGMALAFAVVMGLACLFGSLVPLLVLNPSDLLHPRGLLLLASMPLLFLGLTYCGLAGSRRDKEKSSPDRPEESANTSFRLGLAICVFTGAFGANLNLGFAFSGDLIPRGQSLGANAVTATYPVWALVLSAGFISNLVYCSYLLSRNQTWTRFWCRGSSREAALGIAMALLWLAGIVCYGIGATLVGKYGTSLGFALFMAVTILASNLLGIWMGEWKGISDRTMNQLMLGVGMVLVSVIVLNLGGLF